MSEPRQAPCWCRANYCSHQVVAGGVLCTGHALHLGQLKPELLELVCRIDPRGIESSDRAAELETLADAVEIIAQAERNPVSNPFRRRLAQIRTPITPPAHRQSRLLEDHPGGGGAYGPAGRAQ